MFGVEVVIIFHFDATAIRRNLSGCVGGTMRNILPRLCVRDVGGDA